jgi:nitrile hydratase subunit beta
VSYHSHADLGGQPSSAAVVPEAEADRFHAPWEARAMALTVAMGATGLWNIDMTRAARETLPDYADLSYYQIWIRGLERLISGRRLLEHPAAPALALRKDAVAAVLKRGSPTLRESALEARFAAGDRVRTLATAPPHHTRLPAYARGKSGVIERLHGVHVFADSNAQGRGEAPQWLYTVSFAAKDLWGEAAPEPSSRISIDAWESYLAPP